MPIKLQSSASAVSASSFIGSGRGGIEGGATCALLKDGKVQCWGYGSVVPHDSLSDVDGSSGIGDDTHEMGGGLPTLTFENQQTAKAIAAGNTSAAILNDGTLRLWGFVYMDNVMGFYGATPAELATLPAVQMGSKVISIATGARHACAILEGGTLKCWGNSDSGALGLGSTSRTNALPNVPSVDLGGHAATQVALGLQHTCAILDDGTMKCWGANNSGQLGLGDTNPRGDTGEKLGTDTTVRLSFRPM